MANARRADYNVAQHRAVQALAEYARTGENAPSAQMVDTALRWIIEQAAMTYEESFREEPRVTEYIEGKRSVGLQIVKLINTKVEVLPNVDR